MTSPTILYGRASESVQLAVAIQQCQPLLEDAIVLLYTPSRCYLAVLSKDGLCYEANPQSVNYESVFEARLFTPTHELRWLNDDGGLGRAVLLSEDAIGDGYLESEIDGLSAIATVPQQYMRWGEGIEQGAADGWSTLTTARIGRLSVPEEGIGIGQGACLQSREYLAASDFGNVAVVEERLMSLSAVTSPNKTT